MIRLLTLLLLPAALFLASAGMPAHAAEKKGAAAKKKNTAGKTTADKKKKSAAPAATDKPAAARTEKPDKAKKAETAAKPVPSGTRALTEAEVKQKSSAAGAVMQQFIDARTLDARLPLVRSPDAVKSSMTVLHEALGDGDFALQHGRIMGAAFGGEGGRTLYFPYLLSTPDAPSGFLVPVVDSPAGFRLDWGNFAEGWQRPLQQWISEPDRAEASFCVIVVRTHAFDTRAASEGAGTVVLEVKHPEILVNGDPPVLVAGGRSRSVKTAEELVEWNTERLVRVTLARRDDGWFDLRRIQPVPLPEIPVRP